MNVALKVDGFDDQKDLIISDDSIDSYEFIDLCIDDSEYTVAIEDLYFTIKLFYERRNARLRADASRNQYNPL